MPDFRTPPLALVGVDLETVAVLVGRVSVGVTDGRAVCVEVADSVGLGRACVGNGVLEAAGVTVLGVVGARAGFWGTWVASVTVGLAGAVTADVVGTQLTDSPQSTTIRGL